MRKGKTIPFNRTIANNIAKRVFDQVEAGVNHFEVRDIERDNEGEIKHAQFQEYFPTGVLITIKCTFYSWYTEMHHETDPCFLFKTTVPNTVIEKFNKDWT